MNDPAVEAEREILKHYPGYPGFIADAIRTAYAPLLQVAQEMEKQLEEATRWMDNSHEDYENARTALAKWREVKGRNDE